MVTSLRIQLLLAAALLAVEATWACVEFGAFGAVALTLAAAAAGHAGWCVLRGRGRGR